MTDQQLDNLTLEQFQAQLKALLRRAQDSGLDVDEFCSIAEHILSTDWVE